MKMIHVINPFKGDAAHQKIQNITFESIRRSKMYEQNEDVEIHAAHYLEDAEVIPSWVNTTQVLEQSIQDIFPKNQKRLPLLFELFEQIKKDESIDYVIYSNIDIAIHYQFYSTVKEIIKQGYDAFAINRRRVLEKYQSAADINQLYSEVGKAHAGYDCFVIKRDLLPQFVFGKACIGIPFIDSVMLFNQIAFANQFKLFTDKHLTFHIGFELVKNWGSNEIIRHNKSEYLKALKGVKEHIKISNVPGSGLPFFKRHFKWLMNPTIDYRTIAKIDFRQWKKDRYIQENTDQNGYLEWLQKKVRLDG